MTEAPALAKSPDPETVTADAAMVLRELQKRRPGSWWTASEIGNCLQRWPAISVRRVLRNMADMGEVETRVSGTPDRPLREYRARG